jgi:hypothetical protein
LGDDLSITVGAVPVLSSISLGPVSSTLKSELGADALCAERLEKIDRKEPNLPATITPEKSLY